ncbi:hypothetical protein CY0110_16597 [Crocosphaera chwakensis CCY0110]|uniref:Uncharacterized protein n=1 Tax=Crocosphaera chwakensis CCY0110 TaxID=391612 RepID=A3II01_9CHRO|nr:hypothetical protein CY0110_16597 [Crocosphaera chwakensis CCY0110]
MILDKDLANKKNNSGNPKKQKDRKNTKKL